MSGGCSKINEWHLLEFYLGKRVLSSDSYAVPRTWWYYLIKKLYKWIRNPICDTNDELSDRKAFISGLKNRNK